ncbi:transcriptional regulator [Roseibium algicola]|uniref:Transcriptional regulator n=1 Tax=Roseibium algicola TaxID=2857014 RepID=A0ABN4X0Y1_9HYPH|nr:helix-turn-helix transcriptional regulator [Roseibium aggregatum]AQQ05386.1 transcriptional regulator [Roseibium aggregatum]
MSKSLRSERHFLLLEQLVQLRKAKGLTQEQLANKLGKPQSFVAKYEGGERRLDVVEFLDVVDAIGADPLHILAELKTTP